jgi:hypothetical protein
VVCSEGSASVEIGALCVPQTNAVGSGVGYAVIDFQALEISNNKSRVRPNVMRWDKENED